MKRKAVDATFASLATGFEATITSDALDRDGEVVVPQGMNSTEYESNPILFYNHDTNLPVGKCVKLARGNGSIKGEFRFAQRPEGFTGEYFPEFIASLVGQGIVKGISIGYAPEEGGTRRATIDDRKRYGQQVHTVYSKWKLMEVSVAPLQANPEALISAIRKGAVCEGSARKWLGWQPRRRVQVVVELPRASSDPRALPKMISSCAAREVARRKGMLWL